MNTSDAWWWYGLRVSNLLPRATYTYAFKRSFVFGDENKCGTLKKEKLKRKCKEEYKTFEYCNANCPITKTEKDKISSLTHHIKIRWWINFFYQKQDKQSATHHECIQ